jgi:hypothetical protein
MPHATDNIFGKGNGVVKRFFDKSRKYNDNRIVEPIEYFDGSKNRYLDVMEPIPLQNQDIIISAEEQFKTFGDSLTLNEQEMLKANSPRAALNIVKKKMDNLLKGMNASFMASMYTRPNASTGSLPSTKQWNSFPFLIDKVASKEVCGITPNVDFSRWTSTVHKNSDFTGDLTDPTDLQDPTSDVYILKLLQKGIRMTSHRANGSGKGIICALPQVVWDLTEDLLDPQKTGSALDEMMGQMGFKALNYRDMVILPDDEIVRAQGGVDNTGEIYFINEDYIYMYFHPRAKFASKPFIQGENVLAASKLFYSYGNMFITNRRAQYKIREVYSPVDEVELGEINAMTA